MNWQNSLKNLQNEGIGQDLKHIESRHSSVTTAWGVNWSPTFIARDILQNFFDANREQPTKIQVSVQGKTVTISAPAEFELARLFYLGSEKGEEDIGQYGEGFKAAAVCLLRDHGIEPIAVSGNQVVYIRVDNAGVSGTKLQPVVYDFFESALPFPGSKLVLRGCSKDMIHALQSGMTHFFYPENALLGKRLWTSWDEAFSIYESKTKHGHVFYRNFKRGEIADVPVILVMNKSFAPMEKKIQTDRDRNAFGEGLLALYYKIFSRSGIKGDVAAQKALLLANPATWMHGHPLLYSVAGDYWYASKWTQQDTEEVFGDRYYAVSNTRDHAQGLEFQTMEQAWKKEGRLPLPGYFKRFGVINASDELQETKRKAFEEAKARHHRLPTSAEMGSLQVLMDALATLAPVLMQLFQKRTTRYSVAETETILGELKERRYDSQEVFLASQLFISDFARALAVFLHEHTHVFGYDGSRGFSDALTVLLEEVLRERQRLEPIEIRWEQARQAVLKERRKVKGTAMEHIQSMSEQELRDLVQRLPAQALEEAMKKTRADKTAGKRS